MSINAQFSLTKKMFEEYLSVKCNNGIPYEQFEALPQEDKAAALFVTFYDQITLAWHKTHKDYIFEEDAVDEAMHICCKLCGQSVKQVKEERVESRIKTGNKDEDGKDEFVLNVEYRYNINEEKAYTTSVINHKTYTPAYMYNAIKNAFDCLILYKGHNKNQFQLGETENDHYWVLSQYAESGDGELDLFDTIIDEDCVGNNLRSKELWSRIDKLDDDSMKVLDALERKADKARTDRQAALMERNEEKRIKKFKQAERSELLRDQYIEKNIGFIENLRNSLNDLVDVEAYA